MILKTITLVSNWESYTWLADGSPLERKDRVLREALEAIEIAKNGLDWFKDSYPHDVNESDAEASEQINEAIGAITKELAP